MKKKKNQELIVPDVREGDKLDKFRNYLIKGTKLTHTQMVKLQHYQKANSLLCIGYSREMAVKQLATDFNLSAAQCYVIVRETLDLFGDVAQSNKNGMKHIAYENFMLAANLARKKGDIDSMIRAQEDAAKIYDLFDYKDMPFNPEDHPMPKMIVFTNNFNVLKTEEKKRK